MDRQQLYDADQLCGALRAIASADRIGELIRELHRQELTEQQLGVLASEVQERIRAVPSEELAKGMRDVLSELLDRYPREPRVRDCVGPAQFASNAGGRGKPRPR